uniref:Uncharacterized protein n=1 Tax=Myoviridae sp. ctEBR14 TaxID=2825060 RepID=A0A8S5NY48_9CAUD|nr:MAG TPA: hypothetical protein [Myoviridae sp. ctEBR14]
MAILSKSISFFTIITSLEMIITQNKEAYKKPKKYKRYLEKEH